ncbi:hypothetical protein [Campylobacter corcagiensis]|uniref:Uncharacterized protein n=1 Tax=Campylobacter corcagiensis TaxID=1448857 RepID=A0A7M1LDT2_9BACT|nr:hypothetical protein [Campylobacter corcagiensis]QKF65128.1 hypothetical protein CCORG_1279 [Campylobacter corcagiensis]QOQ86729.1 hypothetical protein IMC76_05765 [Campylobacter corcagiensis]
MAFSYYNNIYNDKFDESLKLIKFSGKIPNKAIFKTIKIHFETAREWAKNKVV